MKTHRIDLFVDNYVGVLDQILILMRRSGWNVQDLHVCAEPAKNGTRIQFTIQGRADLNLLHTQLERLDFIHDHQVDHAAQAGRELTLIKSADRENLKSLAQQYQARLICSNEEGDIYEFTGTSDEVEAFLAQCSQRISFESMRSGSIDL